MLLGGCSSSNKNSSPSSSSTGGGAGGSSSGTASGGTIGVILPDTTSSTRYTLYDAPLLTKAIKDAGLKADVQNAGGSTSKFSQIADSMISEGVKVLVIDSLDPTSGAAVEQKAKSAGIKVIDYDRVNLEGSADYYVSFDNVKVGQLQGNGLVDCLNAKGVKNPQIIEMDGGTDTDNNAVLFAQGYNSVLDPLYKAGTFKKVSETVVKGWKTADAAPGFTQALTANGGKVDGVIAANDDIANAVITVLQNNHLQVPVTGQDAGIEGLQHILQGDQCMTVFKDVSKEADGAAKLAIALAQGKDPAAAGLNMVKFHDPKGNRDLQALLLDPQTITKTNVMDVIKAGALTAAQICKGIESTCATAGIK